METKENVSTVGSVYSGFTDKEKSAIWFLVGCSIEKTENENEYEGFKTDILHVDRLSDAFFDTDTLDIDTNCDNTLLSIFRSFTFKQKTVVEFLIGCAMIKKENENDKQNITYERVLDGFNFLVSEGFYL